MKNFLTHGRRKLQREKAGGIIRFPAGAKLFSQRPPRIYFLRGGRVRLFSDGEVILEHLSPGDFFGETSLLPRRQQCEAAKSLSAVTVSAFRTSQLLDRVQGDRRFARRLLRNLAARLNRRREAIRDLIAEPAERRLAWLLFRLAPSRPGCGWVRLRFTLSNSELAKTIGTTRARIAHFMQHFRQLGWLERRPELWVQREGLRAFLEQAGKQSLRVEQQRRPGAKN
jgi:CRP/FNR family cyclic AMP-dependent transcriptional regulator